MLIAFGLSWPISILKSYRLKFVGGKSMLFLILVLIGYIAGTLAKVLEAYDTGQPLKMTIWLYVINGILVCVDFGLFLRYRNNHEPITMQVAEDIAKIIEKDMGQDKDKKLQ